MLEINVASLICWKVIIFAISSFSGLQVCLMMFEKSGINPYNCQVCPQLADRECPFDWELLGYNMETLAIDHSW